MLETADRELAEKRLKAVRERIYQYPWDIELFTMIDLYRNLLELNGQGKCGLVTNLCEGILKENLKEFNETGGEKSPASE